ncbi:hypothetical protein CAEBREN_21312 [Caenorhabditis brenneri]|uniref:Uncharacterized protein n=1 Tax=Caenorhabditis brenneri TaxID=135651 RepID=G0MIU3_CAEBE|nr:hypothetical protein CAEBREN_21312 [Caenorhabditis brenneri]
MAKLPQLPLKLSTSKAETQTGPVTTTTTIATAAESLETNSVPQVAVPIRESSPTTESTAKTSWKTILFYIIFPIVSLLHFHFRYTELYNFPITNYTFWHILPFHLLCMVFYWDPISVLVVTLYAVISVGLIHWKFSRFIGLTSQNPFRIKHGILYMMGALHAFCTSAFGLALIPDLSWIWLFIELIATPILVYGYFMVDNRFVRFHVSLLMDFRGNRALLTEIAIFAVLHLVLFGVMVATTVGRSIAIPWIYCTSLLLSSFLLSIDYSRIRQEKIFKFQCHSDSKKEYEESLQRGFSWQISKIDIIKKEEKEKKAMEANKEEKF